MATYVMLGRYSAEAVKGISADRTRRARALIEEHGGTVLSMYALLGDCDLLVIADLPDADAALLASLGLTRLTGVAFSSSPAMEIAHFDEVAGGS